MTDSKSLELSFREQLQLSNFTAEGRKKVELNEALSDSDTDIRAEFERAVKKYKQNRKDKRDSHVNKVNLVNKESHKLKSGSEYSNKSSSEAPASPSCSANYEPRISDDFREMINYFLKPLKSQNYQHRIKNHPDNEKQGAMSKGEIKQDISETEATAPEAFDVKTKFKVKKIEKNYPQKHVTRNNLPNANKNVVSHSKVKKKKNSFKSTDIFRVNEETCLKPFFYVVPENPTPNFFLPRGSYYVIPKAPDSSTEEEIVFHPEKGEYISELKHKNSTRASELAANPRMVSSKTNDLGRTEIQKIDSHLNIGSKDLELKFIFDNLDYYLTEKKVSNKILISPNGTNGDENDSPGELEGGGRAEAVSENFGENENLNRLVKCLDSRGLDYAGNLFTGTREGVNDKREQDNISDLDMARKIQNQFDRIVLALPEHSFAELRSKCEEFQGDDVKLDNYIREQQHRNKMFQLSVELQDMFPDADPDYMLRLVREANGDEKVLSNIITENLVEKEYPKISECNPHSKQRRLWEKYVTNFSVENYIRTVPTPENYKGKVSTSEKNKLLALKFLTSRYPDFPEHELNFLFEKNDCNISRTCNALVEIDPVRLKDSDFKNEKFGEEILKELCYIDNQKEIEQYLNEMRDLKEIEAMDARLNNCFLTCPLCGADELVASDVTTCPEGHVFCRECIKRYINVKLGDGIFKYVCPMNDCKSFFPFNVIETLLPEGVATKIIKKQQAEEVVTAKVEGLESCPFCEFAYIPFSQDSIFKCENPECLAESCRKCGEKSHIPLRCEEVERPVDAEARKKIEEAMSETLLRSCPGCQKKFVKIDGCNKICCPCGIIICYICRKSINGYNHFNPRGPCPLYSPNQDLHERQVLQAGVQARNAVLEENPNIHLISDPVNDF